MTVTATEAPTPGPPAASRNPLADEKLVEEWRGRIHDAEQYRRRFELIWLSNLAFVAGQQWLVNPRGSREFRHISEIDDRYADKDLYTADVIKEQRQAALGEFESAGDRPQLLVPTDGDDDESENEIEQQLNRAVGHAWEYEVDAAEALRDVRRKCVDMGVGAIRCRYDSSQGQPQTGSDGQQLQAPIDIRTGQPITDGVKARDYVAGLHEKGQRTDFRQINEGRICWEVGSAFNVLVPPGVPHEKDFPWEIWVRPVPLDEVVALYPQLKGITADSDIQSVLGLGVRDTTQRPNGQQDGGTAKLKEHVWLYTCYERPTASNPQGKVVVLASAAMKLADVQPQLPYKTVNGEWRSGIHYFHWWRLNDRFYSGSLIEALKDPQRMINRRKTQMMEIIDRGMPFILVEEDTVPQKRQGIPMEFMELKKGTGVQPQVQGGVGPGEWFYRDIEALREDLSHASTLSALQLGQNPDNVATYGQLVLLHEKEGLKREPIHADHQRSVVGLVEDTVCDIRKFWPDEKQILVAGESNRVQAHLFNKSKIPDLYLVRPAEGAAKPSSQGARVQLVESIWQAALASGAVAASPQEWIEWYSDSLEAGEPKELPSERGDTQLEKARLENHMLIVGDPVNVAYYDKPDVHVPIHREAQDAALLSGDIPLWQRIEAHVQEHLAVADQNAQRLAAQQAPTLPPQFPPEPPAAAMVAAPPKGPPPAAPDAAAPPEPAPPVG